MTSTPSTSFRSSFFIRQPPIGIDRRFPIEVEAAIAIGGTLGFIILLSGLLFCVHRRMQKRQPSLPNDDVDLDEHVSPSAGSRKYQFPVTFVRRFEENSTKKDMVEAPVDPGHEPAINILPVELPGSHEFYAPASKSSAASMSRYQ